MDTDDAEANMQRFRALLGKNLDDLGAEFSGWANKVFGDLSTVEGAMTALAAGTAAAVVGIAGALVECAHEYTHYVEEVERGSRATGISTEAMSGLHLMAEETGVSYDSLVHGLTRFASTIAKANEGGDAQLKFFAHLGITQKQVAAGEKDMIPLLELVMDRYKQMGPSVMASAEARAAFGRGGAELNRILMMGGEELRKFIEQTKEMGTQVHATDVEAVEGFNATLRVTKSEFTALALEVGSHVLPVLSDFVTGAIAAGVAAKNIGHYLHGGIGEWAFNFSHDMDAILSKVKALAESAAAAGKGGVGFDEPKLKKAKEDFREISEALSEIRTKMADLQGPEAKAADEARRLEERLVAAEEAMKKAHAEGTLTGQAWMTAVQEMATAAKLLPEAIAQMQQKARDAVLTSLRETGEQLREELLRQGPQTLAIKQAEWDAERAAAREKLVEKGKELGADETANLEMFDQITVAGHRKIADDALREQMKSDADLRAMAAEAAGRTHEAAVLRVEAEIADMRAAYIKKGDVNDQGLADIESIRRNKLDKIDRDEKDAYDAELARLKEQLARINHEHETAAQRIEEQYQADVAKFSAAEEKKTLALTTNVWERVVILGMYSSIQAALLLKAQQDTQTLLNSQGWKGVFGGAFKDMIEGNQDLSKKWAESTKQSLMLLKVALEAMNEDLQRTFKQFASGMGSAIANAMVYEKSIGKAMEAALKSTLASLAGQAFAQAIYSLGLGFLDLAEGNVPGAAMAFEAAAMFGSLGAAAGMAGRAIPGGGSGGASGTAGAGSGASTGGAGGSGGNGDTPLGQYGTAVGSSGGGRHVTLNVYGHVFGMNGAQELANMMNDAVLNQGVTLTATNTTTGKQIQR
jgi:hypothetical protein